MTIFQKADLLVNVLTLDDVATREGFRLPEAEDAFVNLVEAAALDVAERHYAGYDLDGAMHIDWNGSRLQFWTSYSRQVYNLVVFQFDHNELAPLVCCAAQDIVFGTRSLTAQFAVMRDGRRVHMERLPKCDDRPRRRVPARTGNGAILPTLHRVMAALHGAWSRVQDLLWRGGKFVGDACLAIERRLVATVAALRDRLVKSGIISLFRLAYGRILALAGCTAEKCAGSANTPNRRFGALFGSGGLIAGLSGISRRLGVLMSGLAQTVKPLNKTKPGDEIKAQTDTIICLNPVSEDHLATLHGIKPVSPTEATNRTAAHRPPAGGAAERGGRS